MDIQATDLAIIEKQIHSNRFGIMKLSGPLGSTLRLLIEVEKMDENSVLHCVTSDGIKRLKNNKLYSASLRLVNKEDGTYTIVEGPAKFQSLDNSKAQVSFAIRSQRSFKKREVSQFTSFLESITPRRAGKLVPGASFYSNHRVA